MNHPKTHSYRGVEIRYSAYGQNGRYSAQGSVRIPNPSVGLTLVFEGIYPPAKTLADAESQLLSAMKHYLDKNL